LFSRGGHPVDGDIYAEFLSRNIEFLFSKNRINVSFSRTKYLSILAACPDLMSIVCKVPD
jgi:uncharacterized protein